MRYDRLKPVSIYCHKAAKIRDELIFRIYDLRFKISPPRVSRCESAKERGFIEYISPSIREK